MKILTHAAAALVGAALVAGLFVAVRSARQSAPPTDELARARQAVAQRLDDLYQRLDGHVRGCARAVAADREFAMKLFVDQDRTAPEVTEIAARYLDPAGLGLLEIADSSWIVLSSGHFPASAGNLIADKAQAPADRPVFIPDRVRGESCLTLQERTSFTIADVTLHCVGGWIVDERFVSSLSPYTGVTVLLRLGETTVGPRRVTSLSELKDHQMIVDNQRFLADTLSLPGGGDADARPVLIVLLDAEESAPRN